MQEHNTLTLSAIVQRFKFYYCNMQTGESIASYIVRLQALINTANSVMAWTQCLEIT